MLIFSLFLSDIFKNTLQYKQIKTSIKWTISVSMCMWSSQKIEVYQWSYKIKGILSIKAVCGTKFSLSLYTHDNVSSVCLFFPHALHSSEETVTILGLNQSLYMSSFLATKDWKLWMEWGLMAELNRGNLNLILLFDLEFSLNTVKPVWLSREITCMLFILWKYVFLQVCLGHRVCF